MRRGKESPVGAPSSPRQTAPQVSLVPSAPLTSFLGGAAFTTHSSTTTTTTHHTSTSAFKPISVGLAPAPCTLPLISPQVVEPLAWNPRHSSVMPGPSSSYTMAPSSALPFPSAYATAVPPAVYASAPASSISATGPSLPADARALLKRKEGSSAAAVNVSIAGSKPAGVRVCTMCGTTKTKQWRSGSDGKPSLCNACGLRYRKDSLGQKFKFKQVIIFPSGTTSSRKRKTLLADDKSKVDSVDEKELTASLAAAKSSSSSSAPSSSKKRQRQSSPAADAQQAGHRSREGSPERKSDIYSLLN